VGGDVECSAFVGGDEAGQQLRAGVVQCWEADLVEGALLTFFLL
jgi:hypothetical protein